MGQNKESTTDTYTVEILRELAKNNKGRTVKLPAEIVDIIEGNKIEKSWKDIDVPKVMNYIASMMEIWRMQHVNKEIDLQ